MWNKAKEFLHHALNVVLAIILVLACASYVGINAILVTEIINALRLDTYVTLETGLGVVFVVLLLGWGPVWLMRALDAPRSRR